MHVLNVVDDLVAFLKDELKDMLLQTKAGDLKSPAVFDGYLPPKQSKRGEDTEQEDYPFVIVRYLGDEDEIFNRNVVTFRLLIGTYSQDEQHGWRDTLSVMIRIKSRLKKRQTIGSANLTGTISSALFEEQRKPIWHGVMEVEFEIPQIQRDWSGFEDEYYRDSSEEGEIFGL